MFLLEITTDQIILSLAGAVVAVAASMVGVAKVGWEWLKNQFSYLTTRIEHLEQKMDQERKRLEMKLDEEREEQDKRIDGIFDKILNHVKTQKLFPQKPAEAQ